MNKETELWSFIAERLKNGRNVMLLIVAESAGSSPGRAGFKMAVTEDQLFGSIGGGVMEVNLAEAAREILKNTSEKNSAFTETQVHRKNSPNASGMICSGEQTVIFFKLTNEHLGTIREISSYTKNSRDRYLRLARHQISVTAKKIPAFAFKFERRGAADFVYEEKLGCKNSLFIIGGGHCALALSELMSRLDFHVSLFDDRADLNTLEKNKFADEKRIVESYEKIGEFISSGANNYVVVMTLGYKYDELVIRKLLDKDFKYFGVLGSRAKMKKLLIKLEKENFSKKKLAEIHTPIGLPINSRTPEEIAVSIAAEIIKVKNA